MKLDDAARPLIGQGARVVEGGAPELLTQLARTLAREDAHFPPDNAPPGYLIRIRIDKVGGIGPWAS